MSDFNITPVGSTGSDYARSSKPAMDVHRHQDVKSPVPMYSFPGNSRLVFKVDEANHEIVVLIVDETSSEVIRTVPGDAMKDLPSGGLIQKNA